MDFMQVTKIERASGDIKWNYQYYDGNPDKAIRKVRNYKVPGFLHLDPERRNKVFLLGQFNQRASVIKFSKRSMEVDWKVELSHPDSEGIPADSPDGPMAEIYSYVQPEGTNYIYACGYAYKGYDAGNEPKELEQKKYAAMFKMDNDGNIKFYYRFGDSNDNTD